jgi:hypothetical protein
MTPENEESYALHGEYLVSPRLMLIPDIFPVVSAEITRRFLTKSSNVYIEINLDGAATQHTSVIEEDTALIWNEEFRMYV